MPSDFEFYQVVKDLPAGRYRLTCRLGCKSGCLGTLRMFVDQNVQYFGKETDYAQSVLTAGEHNTFAAHNATSDYNTLQNMFVDFEVKQSSDVRIGIRTGNEKASGGLDNSGETGTFRVDYFQLYFISEVDDGIQAVAQPQPSPSVAYSMSGQRVQNPHHGLYIIDNRKLLIK